MHNTSTDWILVKPTWTHLKNIFFQTKSHIFLHICVSCLWVLEARRYYFNNYRYGGYYCPIIWKKMFAHARRRFRHWRRNKQRAIQVYNNIKCFIFETKYKITSETLNILYILYIQPLLTYTIYFFLFWHFQIQNWHWHWQFIFSEL